MAKVKINSLAPEPFDIINPFDVEVQRFDDGFIATFEAANISASGDTLQEAVVNAKNMIVMPFDFLENEPQQKLAPAIQQQQKVLRASIKRSA